MSNREGSVLMMRTNARSGWILPALAMGVLLLSGCAESDAGGDDEGPVAVNVRPVASQTLARTIRGIGTLEALSEVALRPEVAGRVIEVAFEEGAPVEPGDLLYELDQRQIRQQVRAREAELSAAEARLQEAERRAQRFERLVETEAVARDDYESAQANYAQAEAEVGRIEAELERTREQLEDTTIEAPFAGQITESHVDAGDYVTVGEHLATLYRTDVLEISFSVPGRYMGQVTLAQPVTLRVAAYPGETFEGQVNYVSPSINRQTRDFHVKGRIDNSDGRLMPGAFATAQVTIEVLQERAVVPEQSLVGTRKGYLVYVVDAEETARRRNVTTGLRKTGVVEIRDGLEPGERVIVAGQMKVSDGSAVDVRAEEVSAAGSELQPSGVTKAE
jgi:membrane fusion protein (multidrug efflux system)